MKDDDKTKEQLIEELKEARRRIEGMESRKAELESLGVLAGEFGHQFNNFLTALTGNIVLAKMYAKPGSEMSDILSEAEKASLQAQDLARRLLIFAKGGAQVGALRQPLREIAEEKVFFPADKRILVMEDEDMVRTVIERMLGQCGCTASFARDGREMLERYKNAMASDRPFDAVIIDLIITGGMGGTEAIKELLEIDPRAKAIVSSGYSEDRIMSNFREFGFKGALAKPYNLSELGKVLSEVISCPG